MTPARGDHEARRAEVSAAVWRVLTARGFAGLTLRAVAGELGATTGLLTHYFPSKRALLRYALDLLDEAHAARDRPHAEAAGPDAEGLTALRAALLDVLPLTPESTAGSRIWVSSWDAALTDPELAGDHAARYQRSRERIAAFARDAQQRGELRTDRGAEDLAAAAQGFVLGLVVQALFAPEQFPPQRQRALLDDYLTDLAAPVENAAVAAPGLDVAQGLTRSTAPLRRRTTS
ncbi:TetR/AcrR family transcriptional regulator [Streptacidiphilus jiangxiensis]|uniref:DNA-binding transcriptional regulator, AcrR family n=1 Tax=Streptacidiphilus jiangxiensis TaxID=235985 RepID=A0A1H7YDT5_STRJI|nr:TetR/AcrR family transcriptional regulator [Streptacidiphilus jiangxiensis]SEM44290.1 DNA-binding transcriptional regulator, AcrR family [Streptacidiphilus jiangxiensis]